MFWVVQSNLYTEQGHEALIQALTRSGTPYVEVGFVPFTHRLIDPKVNPRDYEDESLIPEAKIDDSGLVMVCGSTLLAKVGKERGWKPGSFLNENFHYLKWREHWGENLLNYSYLYGCLGHVQLWSNLDNHKRIFVRPCEDLKAFTGTTMEAGEFEWWRKDLLSQGRDLQWLSAETEIVISPFQEINAEYRFFVVDGKIVTGSMYKLGRRVVYEDCIPPYVLEYAQQMVDMWQPARAFVIDIAETPEGPRVIELNNINQSGFYACNMGKIVQAIEDMEF